jgi:hypothetical protein
MSDDEIFQFMLLGLLQEWNKLPDTDGADGLAPFRSKRGEKWRPIPDHVYQVSNYGRVRRWKLNYGNPGWRLKQPAELGGYLLMQLHSRGRPRSVMLHRLVAEAFVRKPKGWTSDWTVNHLDHNTLNNRVSNLKWCPLSENKKYSTTTKKRGIGTRNSTSSLDARQVRRLRKLAAQGLSTREAAKAIGCPVEVAYAAITYRTYKWVE